MNRSTIVRPSEGEYGEYYHTYVKAVPEGDVLRFLEEQRIRMTDRWRGIDESRAGYRYAEGKWILKEVVGHLADTERIFGYRALSFARQETQELPGFDQNDYVIAGSFDLRPLTELAEEFDTLRGSTLTLFRGFDEAMLGREGIMNETRVTVRAIAYIIAGHAEHHLGVIESRYL